MEINDDQVEERVFELPQKKLKIDWEGFLRSKTCDGQRRYMAKCRSCSLEFRGVVPNLRAHKANCKKMPAGIRIRVSPGSGCNQDGHYQWKRTKGSGRGRF